MVKRIAVLFLCVVLFMAFVIPAGATGPKMNISADKANVKPGDTVVFNVSLSGVEGLAVEGISFLVCVPEGLEIQSGNVLCSSSFALSNFNSESGLFSAVYNAKEKTSAEWDLLEVTCKVTDAASGKMTVRIPVESDFELFYVETLNGNLEYHDIECPESTAAVTAPYNPNAAGSDDNAETEEESPENGKQESSEKQATEKPSDNSEQSDTVSEDKKEDKKPSSDDNNNKQSNQNASASKEVGTDTTFPQNPSDSAPISNKQENADETNSSLISPDSENTAMTDGIDDAAMSGDTAESAEPAEKPGESEADNRMLIIYACIGIVAVIAIAAIVAALVKKRKK